MDSRIPSLRKYFSLESNSLSAVAGDIPHKKFYADRARVLINTCILQYLGRGQKVFIPRYTCHQGTPIHNPNLVFYNVNYRFEPIFENSDFQFSNGDLVVFVNYFGYECSKKSSFYLAAKSSRADILFDNSHSFNRHSITCSILEDNEASVCSYVKSLPVPFGAELIAGMSFPFEGTSTSGEAEKKSYSLRVRSILFFFREQLLPNIVNRKKYLRRDAVQFFNKSFNETINSSQSELVRWINRHIKLEKLNSHRWDATKRIYSIFHKQICFQLPDDIPPTDVPIYFTDKSSRDRIAFFFLKQGLDVYAWPELYFDIASNTDFDTKDKMLLLPTTLKYENELNYVLREIDL